MVIYGINEAILLDVLGRVNRTFQGNIRFKDCRKIGESRGGGETWRVTLTVNTTLPIYGCKTFTAPGARVAYSMGKPRRVAAACWHVYGRFLNSLPKGTRVRSGNENLTAPAPWKDRDIGSMAYPVKYSEACDCAEYGTDQWNKAGGE